MQVRVSPCFTPCIHWYNDRFPGQRISSLQLDTTYYSRLYRDFLAIDPSDSHGIIRYYEANEDGIRQLDEKEYFVLLLHYTQALFAVKAYRQHLAVVDHTLYTCLNQTGSEDIPIIFRDLLFMKAAAAQRNLQTELAEHVLRELIRIDADYPRAASKLRYSLRQQDRTLSDRTRAISILLFGLAAIVIAIEILFVRPFYDLQAPLVESLRNGIFLLGLLVLGGGEVLSWWRAHRRTQAFVRMQQHRQATREYGASQGTT
jgi:hypothetical protein